MKLTINISKILTVVLLFSGVGEAFAAAKKTTTPPPVVPVLSYNRSAANVYPPSLKLHWTPTDGGKKTRYILERATSYSPNGWIPVNRKKHVKGKQTYATFDNNLDGNITYYYRVRVTGNGPGAFPSNTLAVQMYNEPHWPYVKTPPLHFVQITMKDKSKTQALVIPNRMAEMVFYSYYRRAIQLLGYQPHSGLPTDFAQAGFVACDPAQDWSGYILSGWQKWPQKEVDVFNVSVSAENTAWSEAARVTQNLMLSLMSGMGALTEKQIKNLKNVSSIKDAGAYIPKHLHKVDGNYLALWAKKSSASSDEAIPVIAEIEKKHILHYNDGLVGEKITNQVSNSKLAKNLLNMAPENLNAANLKSWLQSVNILKVGDWRPSWSYRYCFPKMSEKAQWKN